MRTKKIEEPTYLQYKKYAKGGVSDVIYSEKFNIQKDGEIYNTKRYAEQISKLFNGTVPKNTTTNSFYFQIFYDGKKYDVRVSDHPSKFEEKNFIYDYSFDLSGKFLNDYKYIYEIISGNKIKLYNEGDKITHFRLGDGKIEKINDNGSIHIKFVSGKEGDYEQNIYKIKNNSFTPPELVKAVEELLSNNYAKGGELKDENGYLKYTIEDDELIIDKIKVYKQRLGTGKKLIKEVKEIAAKKKLPITLYAYPQDETINEDDLKEFYYSQGFDLHPDDVDGSLFIYGSLKKYAKGGALNTYKNKYNRKYGYPENESHNLEQISKDTGVSLKGLQQIYNKGIGAYKTNPESVRKNVHSKEQWAMGRVYSAVMGGKASKVDSNELKMENGGELDYITQLEKEYNSKSLDELMAINKKLYSKVDIESAMSAEEKLLKKIIAKKFSDINQQIIERRRLKKLEKESANKMAKGGLLAPNGKASNLTAEQWKLVRTTAFKKWFGDWENDPENASKVVDENGEPLVVYHGTDKEFNVFDFDKADLGFHFGTYEQAKNRAENKLKLKESKAIIRPFFINIKNFYELTDVGEWEYPQRYIDTLISYNIIDEKDAKILGFFRLYQKEDNIKIREYLLEKYKNSIGFIYNNEYEGKGQSFIILNSTQIKLADGTNTTFDANNPDIRYEEGGEIQSMINEGIVEIEFYDTTIAHAKEYGIESKKPLYLKRIFLSENNRNKGLGKKLIKYLYDFAVENGNDVIFGHIATKSSYIEILKHLLLENGYTINDKNNDFYIMITKENKYNTGGDLKKSSIISLPDTYSSYDSLKPILENQGYELIKKNNLEMSTEKLEIEDNRSVSELDMKYPELPHSFINEQLMAGIKHEMEHTEDPRVAKKIAIDHLLENIHYYEYLAEMEQKMQGKNIDEHYESITKMYEEGGKVETFEFSTPTGKTSKLNYLQQVLVRTKAFKNFFGDWELAARNYQTKKLDFDEAYKNVSKCIDYSTLEPRVVYHGTQADKEFFTFDVTQEKKIGRPYAYFAYNREYSLNFSGGTNKGYMYAVFLNIRNPFNAQKEWLTKPNTSAYFLNQIKSLIQFDKYGDNTPRKELSDTVDSQIKSYIQEVYADQPYYFWLLMARDVNKEFKYFLMSHGYDGIFSTENFTTVFDRENPSEFTFTYIAFDANQIKLADGRNIDFDPMNADIRYEEGGKTVDKKEVIIEQQEPTQNVSQIDYLRNNLRKFSEKDAEINQTIFKSGGHVQKDSGSPDDAKDGGLFVGRSHATGGIKAINLSTNQPIEVEGGEVIITKPAVEDQTKREFEGKMMTNKEILSYINQSGGGVSFEKGGEMGNSCGCSGKMYKFGGETISDYMVLRKITTLYDESIKNVKNYVDNLSEQFK